jgi:hypothetical protein
MEKRTISRMTQKPIRLSALGRDVKVGDLYNYNTDFILKSKLSFRGVFIILFHLSLHMADSE